MPPVRTAEDMLATELKSIYSAEQQITRTLPKLAKKIGSQRLKEMLSRRVEQGEELLEDIDEALGEMEVPAKRPKNLAAKGLIEDVDANLADIKEERLIDPFVLASVQKVEHYCIGAWGTAKAIAQLLENDQVVETMEKALSEGKEFDKEMTELAEGEVNAQLLEGEEDQEEEED